MPSLVTTPATASAAQAWSGTPLRRRLAWVRKLRSLIARRAEYLVAAAHGPRRSDPRETLTAEVIPLADACRFLERNAPRLLADRRLPRRDRPLWLAGVRVTVRRRPFGVVLVIGPANYPLFLPGVQAVQALTAGNAVLLKPGAGGAPAAQALAGLAVEAGLDPRLLTVLDEAPDAAAAAIAQGVDKVFLTGGAEAGSAVLAQLAPQATPAVMELSGCDAAFVLPGADLELAARSLNFALRLNAGATCIAPRRLFAVGETAAPLAERLAALLAQPPFPAVPPADAARAEILVREAVSSGARLLAGGVQVEPVLVGRASSPVHPAGTNAEPLADGPGGPSYERPLPSAAADALAAPLRPVLLTDVPPDAELLCADLMAPVLALLPAATTEEALAANARCPYRLGAAVFGPREEALRLAARLDAGCVVVNDALVPTADPRAPFGGGGRSGFGVTRGGEGLLEMTRVQTVLEQRARWRPHLDSPRLGDYELLRDYLAFAHGGGWGERASAAWRLVRRILGRSKS